MPVVLPIAEITAPPAEMFPVVSCCVSFLAVTFVHWREAPVESQSEALPSVETSERSGADVS
jgi:hypothetical protein